MENTGSSLELKRFNLLRALFRAAPLSPEKLDELITLSAKHDKKLHEHLVTHTKTSYKETSNGK